MICLILSIFKTIFEIKFGVIFWLLILGHTQACLFYSVMSLGQILRMVETFSLCLLVITNLSPFEKLCLFLGK